MNRRRLPAWRATVVILVAAAAASTLLPVSACGLEATIRGGFSISHPGALDVAVAVADSRRSGLLPPATPVEASNGVLLQQMLGDLERLQTRLNSGLAGEAKHGAAAFSLVLVGPGLWSHYHPTPDGIRAEYHVNGPLAGQTVVLTHHSVLRALLKGNITTEQATRLGLLAFSGDQSSSVRKALESSFLPST